MRLACTERRNGYPICVRSLKMIPTPKPKVDPPANQQLAHCGEFRSEVPRSSGSSWSTGGYRCYRSKIAMNLLIRYRAGGPQLRPAVGRYYGGFVISDPVIAFQRRPLGLDATPQSVPFAQLQKLLHLQSSRKLSLFPTLAPKRTAQMWATSPPYTLSW